MIKGQAVGQATTTIMPSNREVGKAELFYDGDHVSRHRSFRIGRMIGSGSGIAAAAVAAKVRADHSEAAGRSGHDVPPHQVRLNCWSNHVLSPAVTTET